MSCSPWLTYLTTFAVLVLFWVTCLLIMQLNQVSTYLCSMKVKQPIGKEVEVSAFSVIQTLSLILAILICFIFSIHVDVKLLNIRNTTRICGQF